MNQAFLLPTGQRVVSAIEVRHQNSLVPMEEFLNHGRLPGGGETEDGVLPVRHHPNVLVLAMNVDFRFINMDYRSGQDAFKQAPLGKSMFTGRSEERRVGTERR